PRAQRRGREDRRVLFRSVHARRVRPPSPTPGLGAARFAPHARGGLVERLPRHAVLPAGRAALGVVLSRYRAHPGVPRACAVRDRRFAVAARCMLRVRARFVHPVTAPPIEDGAVLVDDRGTIAAVGPHPRVPTPRGARELDFPQASLVPGLVNTHTHLELTHLAGKNSERDFAAWIRTLRALKDATTPETFLRSAELGVRDAWAAGVTCVADTGSTGASLEAL